MKTAIRIFVILSFIVQHISSTYACDNTPLLVVYDPVEISAGQWDLEVFVCFGSEESADGFTLESTDGSLNIVNATPAILENPYNGNLANALFSGGILNYYYDNSGGDNYNDSDGETGPCVDFNITVDGDPSTSSFTMAGVNDGCLYTISEDHLTSEVTFTPPCFSDQSLIAPGTINGNTEFAAINCNFRSPIFSTVKEEIIKVTILCDGNYTFSLCGSSFDTWMALSYQCCFLPFASNNDNCGLQSEINVDLLAGTYYVLVEGFLWDDYGDYILNVTSSTDAVSIDSIESTDPQCSQVDGEIIIHALGSDGPFSYSIDGGNSFVSDSVFSGLSAGNYFIVVQGQSGCQASTTLSINTNPPLILDGILATNDECGSSNGSITINVSSGTPPYLYSIDNGATLVSGNIFTNLQGGDYLINVIDDNGCELNSIYTLDSTSTPIIQELIISNPSCGLNTGQIEIIANGDGILNYSIDGVNFQSSPVFSGLYGGFYPLISVTTASACSADTSATLTDLSAPVIDQINLNATACDNSGSIEIIASGGSGSFLYSIDGGINYSISNLFSGLLSNTYTIQVIDSSLCIVDSLVFLPQNTSISIDGINLTDPSCDSGTGVITDNGEIDIIASGGIGSLSYSIDDGANFQAASTFTTLTYGAYTIVVSDGTCEVDSLISLSTNPGPSIDILDARDLTCGLNNGFIAVKVVNPINPDYIYEFDNGIDNIQSAPTPDDQYSYDLFTAGIWNIIVTDGNGCKGDTAIVLGIEEDISISTLIIDSAHCGANDASVTIVATSGNLPIEYSLNEDMSAAQGNGFFNGLSAGSYTFYLRDDRFCLDTLSLVIPSIDGPIIDSLSSTNPICEDHNGEITIFASSGTPPYFYSVNNGLSFQTGNLFTGLHDETYEIIVLDAGGCVSTATITLIQEGGITMDVDITHLHCGELNGELLIMGLGGDNNYNYTINNGIPQSNTSGIFIGLESSTYSINVEDGQGCTVDSIVFIDSIPPPFIDNLILTHTNCGGANGSIQIVGGQGSNPYQYSIDAGQTFQDSALFIGLTADIYQVYLIDSLQCVDSTSAEILPSIPISISAILLSDPTCGDSTGAAIIIVEDATPPINYVLQGIDSNTTGSFDALLAGDYIIQVEDSLGCTADSSFTLSDNLVANPPSITMPDYTACSDSAIIYANDPQGNVGEWTVIIGGASVLFPTDTLTLVIGLSLGANQFVWTISNGDCPATSDTLTITKMNGITVDAGEDQFTIPGSSVTLNGSADLPGDYSWTPSSFLDDPSLENPVATVDVSTQFVLTVTGEQSCFGMDSVLVTIAEDLIFGLAFTPDGDGNNDTWVIQNIELFPNATVTIMNRYGNIVFDTQEYLEAWNGQYKGKDVPVGSYFYIIELGEGFETKTGSVSVIR